MKFNVAPGTHKIYAKAENWADTETPKEARILRRYTALAISIVG
ncbi:hypothetical protein SRS16P3_00157 (plasmid) [Variovorax sp. SRS16]|nr:hypothetical protein [Variovorax sp. SRS16]VTU46445.1 hypothetical protein SRS16P3_00157 [Variovorax sp. SRS16]